MEGETFVNVRVSPKNNGPHPWRLLKNKYDTQTGRHAEDVSAIRKQKEQDDGKLFMETLRIRESIISDYSLASVREIPDKDVVTVILEHAPDRVQPLLRQT